MDHSRRNRPDCGVDFTEDFDVAEGGGVTEAPEAP